MLDEVSGHYHHQLFSLPSWLPCCLDFLCWSGSIAASFGSFVALVVLQTLGDLRYVQQPRAGTKLHQPGWAIMKLGSSCATRTFCHLTAAWNFAWKFWYLLCSSAIFDSYTHIDLGGYGSKKIVPKAQQIWSSSVFTIRTHTMIYLLYIYIQYVLYHHISLLGYCNIFSVWINLNLLCSRWDRLTFWFAWSHQGFQDHPDFHRSSVLQRLQPDGYPSPQDGSQDVARMGRQIDLTCSRAVVLEKAPSRMPAPSSVSKWSGAQKFPRMDFHTFG